MSTSYTAYKRHRNIHHDRTAEETQRHSLEEKSNEFQEPIWNNSEGKFLNPGICLGQHIFVRASLRFVLIVVYCPFSTIKWGNIARIVHCFVDLQRDSGQCTLRKT